jgi:hypothetical protein
MIKVGDLVRLAGQTGLRHLVGLVFEVRHGGDCWNNIVHVRWVCDGSEVADSEFQFEVVTNESR